MKKLALISLVLPALMFSCDDKNEASDAYGNFESDPVIVSAQGQGQIIYLNLQEGQKVGKNQELGVIDTMQIYLKKLQLESGKQTINTRFQTLDNQINSISIQIQNAEREYKRISSLLNDGAATGKQKDDIEGSLHLLKAQRKALESQKATLYAEKKGINVQIAQLEDQVKKSRIINPIEGIVLQQYKRQGEIVGPGQAIYKVANMDQLILRAYVSGYQLSELSLGAKLKVRIDAGDEIKELSGEVRWIASEAEFTPKIIQTREERVNLVYAVKVAVENDGSLKIGMPGEIKF